MVDIISLCIQRQQEILSSWSWFMKTEKNKYLSKCNLSMYSMYRITFLYHMQCTAKMEEKSVVINQRKFFRLYSHQNSSHSNLLIDDEPYKLSLIFGKWTICAFFHTTINIAMKSSSKCMAPWEINRFQNLWKKCT